MRVGNQGVAGGVEGTPDWVDRGESHKARLNEVFGVPMQTHII